MKYGQIMAGCLYWVLVEELGDQDYILGDFSLVDCAFGPWLSSIDLDDFPTLYDDLVVSRGGDDPRRRLQAQAAAVAAAAGGAVEGVAVPGAAQHAWVFGGFERPEPVWTDQAVGDELALLLVDPDPASLELDVDGQL